MNQCKTLPYKFNLSWGYLPVLIALLLGGCIAQEEALYIGAATGVLSSLLMWRRKGAHIPPVILYCTTAVLSLLTIVDFVVPTHGATFLFPLLLETGILLPTFILYLNRKRFSSYMAAQSHRCCKQLFGIGAEATIVSARIVLLTGMLHWLFLLLAITFCHPLGSTLRHILFGIAPVCVFALSILFNQLGIYYFNRIMEHTAFVPIVNRSGDVIGKLPVTDVIGKQNAHIHPIVRIAVYSQGMLLLAPHLPCANPKKEKMDFPLECYLFYGETLEQGAARLIKQALPAATRYSLRFCQMHCLENEAARRLVYLFILEIDENALSGSKIPAGNKLWTTKQIEDNLHKGFFSHSFECEYEVVKSFI